MQSKFRYYQTEADDAIYNELLNHNKCIVKMFCGTGKSLIMRYCKSTKKQKLCVYVFPSLSLIEQFQADYLTDFPKDQILLISSDLEGTTNPTKIQTFLKKKRNKIICITYHSYETLRVLTKDQKNIYLRKTIHEKSRRIIYRRFHLKWAF